MYKNIEELQKDNPPAVTSKHGDYLERPESGWREWDENKFIGIGYHGNESGAYKDDWKAEDPPLGHIPYGGYG